MADQSTSSAGPPAGSDSSPARASRDREAPGDVVSLVVDYAKQETLGPLRGAGRWLGAGVAGALLLGLGSVFVLLGLLRLLQTEWTRSAEGSLSWLSYAIVLVASVLLLVLVLKRINKAPLNPSSPPAPSTTHTKDER